MTELIFATNNQNKVDEIQALIPNDFLISTLKEAGIDIEIPEPYDTLQENARTKSTTIHGLTSKNCFSEDTGLFVEALNGQPGVKSARYAGEGKNFSDNVQKLLTNLKGNDNRKAYFHTVISLILEGKEIQFEGLCSGKIITEPKGEKGFGYDPIFIPDGSTKTFAEMTMDEKNRFSHRKKAMAKLLSFLSQIGK